MALQRLDYSTYRARVFSLLSAVVLLFVLPLLAPATALAETVDRALIADCDSTKAPTTDVEMPVLRTNADGGKGEDSEPAKIRTSGEEATDVKSNENENAGAKSNSADDANTKNESAPASSKPKYVLRDPAPLPKRISSFLTGLVVGPPVATVRRTFSEDKEAANTVMYGKKASGLEAVARVVLFPLMIVPGAIEGVSDAVENSWKYSSEQPFSKNAFSLGKLGASEE